MKRIGFSLFMLILVLGACNSGGNRTIKANQLILSDTTNFTTAQWLDSVVNFGTIKMGEKIRIQFRVKNTGKKPLFLTAVHPVCGCTVADYTKEAISPGGEGVITGAFDSKLAHTGIVRKSILATTNSRNGINHNLIFTGVINE